MTRAPVLAAGGAILVVLAVHSLEARLWPTEHATGWLLLVVLVSLAAFGLRKKVPYLPLGSAATWCRVHLYLGLFAVVLLGAHVGVKVPNGVLEVSLAVVFAVVTVSGIAGIVLSRSFARRLTTRGQEVIWERIPELEKRIRDEAEAIVQRSVETCQSTAITDLYDTHIAPFLTGPSHFFAHVLGSRRPLKTVVSAIEALDRYANDAERELSLELRQLAVMKDDLDFHWALQSVLKGWLFVHVPATALLLLLAAVHGVVAEVFAAGLR